MAYLRYEVQYPFRGNSECRDLVHLPVVRLCTRPAKSGAHEGDPPDKPNPNQYHVYRRLGCRRTSFVSYSKTAGHLHVGLSEVRGEEKETQETCFQE